MKYAFAAAAVAVTGAMAHPSNVTIVTEVVESYVTYCPEPTEITHGTKTYTVTEPTTLTITDCPCTVTKPVIPTSTVVCHDCPEKPEPTEVHPPVVTDTLPPPHTNGTIPGVPMPTGTVVPPPGEEEPQEPVPTGAAAKFAGISGVAGLAGLAAFFL